MGILRRITAKIDRDLYRLVKHTKQWLHPSGKAAKALFVCGSQRSGTNMLIGVLNKSRYTRVYNEDHPLAFEKYRLKPALVIRALVDRAPCPWVVFKSIMDSQNIRQLLEEFPESKCVWIYRDYRDVAESAEKKWMDAQRHIIRNIAMQDNSWDRWYTEKISPERRDLIRRFYHQQMNETTAGALKWYLRNMLFFDLKLSGFSERVLLVNYNRLVTEQVSQFDRIGTFLGVELENSSYRHVHHHSLQKPLNEPIEQGVRELCDQVMSDFEGILLKLQ